MDQIKIVLTTLVVFAGGLIIGVWTQRTQPAPPPPIPVMGEFAQRPGPPGAVAFGTIAGGPPMIASGRFGPPGPAIFPPPGMPLGGRVSIDPERVREAIAKLTPQIEAFRARVNAIDQQSRAALEGILRPEQRKKLAEMPELPLHGSLLPGCIDPGPYFISMVIYKPLLQSLTDELNLDDDQKKKAEQQLIRRRNRLLELIDETPPPSLAMGRMVFTTPIPSGPLAHQSAD